MKNKIIKGTLILSAAGILTRFIGFYYRIFLSNTIGASGIGLYQMIFPLYNLCLSLTVVGIETTVSKYVAEKNSPGNEAQCLSILKTGLSIAVYLSIAVSFLLYLFSEPIARCYLGDIRCKVLLQYSAYAIPFCSIHGCIFGYFLGKSNAWVPAVAQLVEQLSRTGIVFILSQLSFTKSYLSPSVAVLGLFIGEFASALLCVIALLIDIRKHTSLSFFALSTDKNRKYYFPKRKLLAMSYPISAGRVLTSIILSSEAVLILNGLKDFGLLHDDALQVYGVLSGMAMPFIFFPSTITMSLSSMILPSISEAQSVSNTKKIARTTDLVVQYCFAVGIFFTGIFFLFGQRIGVAFYNNADAGNFISVLSWLCPFMYLGSTLSSILNGLGLTKTTFLVNITSALLRVLSIYLLVPVYGITGYLWGLLLCHMFSAGLLLALVKKHTHFHYNTTTCIIFPAVTTLLCMIPSLKLCEFLEQQLHNQLMGLCAGILLPSFLYAVILLRSKKYS